MRILIVSDTHGRHDYLFQVLNTKGPFDLLLHLGDAEGKEGAIFDFAGCPVEIVCGNSDGNSWLDEKLILKLEGFHILMTHGHKEHVSSNIEQLRRLATDRCVDIALFGHTHHPYKEVDGGILLLNPGSISFPRPFGQTPTYAIMELEKNKKIQAELYSIERE